MGPRNQPPAGPEVIWIAAISTALFAGGCTAPDSPGEDQGPTQASTAPSRPGPPSTTVAQELPAAPANCPPAQVRSVALGDPGSVRYAATALEVEELEALSGVAVNEAGQVVGTARVGGIQGFSRAFRWTPEERVAHIDAGRRDAQAQDINGSGQVAGRVWHGEGSSVPFVWDEMNGLRELGQASGLGTEVDLVFLNDLGQLAATMEAVDELWGSTGFATFRVETDGSVQQAPVANAQAVALNAQGAVLLTSETASGNGAQLYLWEAGTDLRGGGLISASSIPELNDGGLVVAAFGVDGPDGEVSCGFLWNPGTGEQTLIGLGANPSDVNEAGHVTGTRDTGKGRHAFLWDATDGLIDLGVPPGFQESFGTGINERGQVLGYAARWGDSGDEDRSFGFVWDPDAGFVELAPLRTGEWTALDAITNSGLVAGVSGPLDPENGVIVTGQAAIWAPVH